MRSIRHLRGIPRSGRDRRWLCDLLRHPKPVRRSWTSRQERWICSYNGPILRWCSWLADQKYFVNRLDVHRSLVWARSFGSHKMVLSTSVSRLIFRSGCNPSHSVDQQVARTYICLKDWLKFAQACLQVKAGTRIKISWRFRSTLLDPTKTEQWNVEVLESHGPRGMDQKLNRIESSSPTLL